MPYTKPALQSLHIISMEDVDATLNACGLPTDRDEYSDEEIQSGFDVIRSYFNNEQANDYDSAAELFKQQIGLHQESLPEYKPKTEQPATTSTVSKPTAKGLAIHEVLSLASEQAGTRISLIEAGRILEACGLPDQDEYTDSECDRFLEACDLIKKQDKTYEEIAAYFEVRGADEADNVQQIVEQVSSTAVSTESGLVSLVDKVTDKQAEGLPGLVRQSYLKNASRRLAESRANDDLFFAELEKRIMTKIEGKSPTRILMKSWDREANSLPPSSPKPMSLPEGSDDGTNGE